MKSYKEYAEQYGLGIDIIRWVFRHIRVTRYIGTEPVGYRISFKYSGRSVRCESGWKTKVAEQAFQEILDIQKTIIAPQRNNIMRPLDGQLEHRLEEPAHGTKGGTIVRGRTVAVQGSLDQLIVEGVLQPLLIRFPGEHWRLANGWKTMNFYKREADSGLHRP